MQEGKERIWQIVDEKQKREEKQDEREVYSQIKHPS